MTAYGHAFRKQVFAEHQKCLTRRLKNQSLGEVELAGFLEGPTGTFGFELWQASL